MRQRAESHGEALSASTAGLPSVCVVYVRAVAAELGFTKISEVAQGKDALVLTVERYQPQAQTCSAHDVARAAPLRPLGSGWQAL